MALKTLLRHKAVCITSFASFLFAAGGFIWAYASMWSAAAVPLVLHFNDMDGITSTGGLGSVAFAGIFGVAVVVINFFLALELDARDRFLGKTTAALGFVFAVLLFIAFAAILNVN